jgi:hypothetical protein
MGFDTLDRDRASRTAAVKRLAPLIGANRHMRGMATLHRLAAAGFIARR